MTKNRSRLGHAACAALLVCALLAPKTQADVIATGDVDPADPTAWDKTTVGFVGKTSEGTLRLDGGSGITSYAGYIGTESSSTGEVTVDGSGSTWEGIAFFFVGFKGTGTLNITDGGTVDSNIDYIGRNTGSTGMVTVDGPGSSWTNGEFIVGRHGNGTLNITGGGAVASFWTRIGKEAGSISTVTVDGTGSTWTNGGSLYIGNYGTGTLAITGGGVASTKDKVRIGAESGSQGTVTVDGIGSKWTSTSFIRVGDSGTGTLAITGGGAVESFAGYIGSAAETTGTVVVDGAGSTWTNSGRFIVGFAGTGTLSITNGAAVSNVDDASIGSNGTSKGTVTVDGAGSTWTNSKSVSVGSSGSGTLTVTNGAAVSSSYTRIGDYSGSTGTVTVDGTGSTWTNSRDISVGSTGAGTLSVTNGGTVVSGEGFIGRASVSTGTVTVDGIGSTWTIGDYFRVGYRGAGTLEIIGGGAVSSASSSIGVSSGSTGTVTVDGAGSTWTNSRYLRVSRYGATGTLNITNGGQVDVGEGVFLGEYGAIYFDGGVLNAWGGLIAGSDELTGTGTINTDGLVSDVDLTLNSQQSLTQTLAFNGPSGETVTVNLDLTQGNGFLGAGKSGTGSLRIQSGMAVSSSEGYVGYDPGSQGMVTVDGAGSTWTNGGYLYIGNYGTGMLSITNGGAASNSYGYIGHRAGSTGTATVDGPGSEWTSSASITVGNDGTGTLSITNGAVVSSQGGGFVGKSPESQGTVTVDGAGSTWHSGVVLMVGGRGIGMMSVTNGAVVSSIRSDIASGILSTDPATGMVTVDGIGSTWIIGDYFRVGYKGAGTLEIIGGGAVSSASGSIGVYSDSTGIVTVDGAGSTWTIGDDLTVGRLEGTGTLEITGGGLVSIGSTLTIDWDGNGDGYINMATGGMLALIGKADTSMNAFLGLIEGTDDIRFWDGSDWSAITNATPGSDYTLQYIADTNSDLYGYTKLTVLTPIPEPATLWPLALAGFVLLLRRRRRG